MANMDTAVPSPKSWIGIIQIITAAICWGTLGIFSTYLNQIGFSGWQVTILRIVTAAFIILAMLPKLWPDLIKLRPKHWLGLALQSLIGVLSMSICYFFAVSYVGAGPAVALLYTAPVFSLLFSAFLLNESITRKSALLSLMAVFGVGLTMLGEQAQVNWGILLGLSAGVCYSLYGVLGKRAMHYAHPAPLVFFTSIIISAGVLLLLPETYNTYEQLFSLPLLTWGYVLGLSLLGTVVPFGLYMKALEKLPASRASVFTIFEPLTAIALAILLLHQSLSLIQYVGVVLILLAALFNAVLNGTATRVPRWLRLKKRQKV
ncbi:MULTISPECIES: DMT family transporter [unclassified Psychrobacter]|uniref:DMT family transporter n=1 Tax=unclassified Psychrobacter TaxID=196806 RepID=UPI0018CF7E36|nr:MULTISPECIES: EamA family transporter [unclassified Psychrobacter]MBH0065603.1 EamA family transporter [Psychrobacter sp. SZ93C1]MBH0085671.1 EamA family transporter [Psychrobacter sp. SCQQ22]